MYNRHPAHCQNITKPKVWWPSQNSKIGTFKSMTSGTICPAPVWRAAPLKVPGHRWGDCVTLYSPRWREKTGFQSLSPRQAAVTLIYGTPGKSHTKGQMEELSPNRCCHVSNWQKLNQTSNQRSIGQIRKINFKIWNIWLYAIVCLDIGQCCYAYSFIRNVQYINIF